MSQYCIAIRASLYLPAAPLPPMRQELVDNWRQPQPPAHPWTVPHLLASQEAAGREIGLILDLSNHSCLYTNDIPPGVQHKHIKLVAKASPPMRQD